MAFLTRNGVRLHYQVAGDGPPLLLHHGFAGSLAGWRHFGFASPLQSHYRLILPDARGHGLSDKPHDIEAYALQERVDDVLAILDALQIERTHFMGYSMGGMVAFGMAQCAPQRLRSLVIGGAHPYEDHSWDGFHGIDGNDGDAFIAAFETALNERLSDKVRAQVRGNDLLALSAAAQQPRPSMEHVLPALNMPCLLYCGDADIRHAAVRRCADALADARFASLPGLSHFESLMRSDMALPHILPFLERQAQPVS
ncbi:MAG: alpha/beta fold hydrolase [Herbaspirillum sp.]|jgi:pimeloyl-ACP methyl ester carboxylesterase|nr:alpha/beta fold hydrolase [Herbaspirillum sp.]